MNSHSKWYVIEGIVLVLLGAFSILLPTVATLAIELLVGWVFVISAVSGLITSFRTRNSPGFIWSLVSALIGLVAGAALLIWPLVGVLSLTSILTAFLILRGMTSILFALAHKRYATPRWGYMLLNGVVSILLVAVILWSLPISATWVIGLIVGLNMIFSGLALIGIALQERIGVTSKPAPLT